MAQLGNRSPPMSVTTESVAGRRLANRIALVTGASRGLGRFFAETLAREGAHVILGNRSAVPEVTDAIAHAGGKANFVAMDVTRDDSILRAFAEITTQWGPPAIVLNNAGITEVVDTLEEDPVGFDRVLSTNLRGPWMIAREAARHMVAAKRPGSIVNVASIGQAPLDFGDLMIEHGYSGARAYGQSKLAQIMFGFELAARLPSSEVTVNSLHPATYMPTKMVLQSVGRSIDGTMSPMPAK